MGNSRLGFEGYLFLLDDESVDSFAQVLEGTTLAALDLGAIVSNTQSNAYVRKDVMAEGKSWYAAMIFPRGEGNIAVILPNKSEGEDRVRVYLQSEAARTRAVKLLGDLRHHINMGARSIPDIEDLYQDR
jgi:hypothetical protein